MRIRTLAVLIVSSFLVLPVLVRADNYKVDKVHSTLVFSVKHMNVSNFFGRFNEMDGTIVVDEDPTKMQFDISVPLAKIDTANAKRDQHLKGPEFFSAKEFPKISFKSTSVKAAGENKFEVAGKLTLHGQTKDITVTLEKTGQADTPQGPKVGFAGEFSIKRSEYGMNQMLEGIGDDVRIMLGIEADKQ